MAMALLYLIYTLRWAYWANAKIVKTYHRSGAPTLFPSTHPLIKLKCQVKWTYQNNCSTYLESKGM